MTARNEIWVTCPPCTWTWIIAYLPMDVSKLAKVNKAARCPKCGEHKGLQLARDAEIIAALAKAAP